MNNSLLKYKWIPYVFIAVLVSCLYGQYLQSPIFFDDYNLFMLNEDGSQYISLFHFNFLALRSIAIVTLAWTKQYLGLDLLYFHAGNILVHCAVSFALFKFLVALSQAVFPKEVRPNIEIYALIAVLIFALHPVSTYAAGYIAQRTILMATLFSILTMYAYLVGVVRNKPLVLYSCVPLYYLAVFSKEQSITLIAVLPALSILLSAEWLASLKKMVPLYIALGCIALVAILSSRGIFGAVYEFNAGGMLTNVEHPYLLSVLTQTWLFFKYILLWIFPNPQWMSLDMREPFAQSVLSPYVISAVTFLLWGGTGAWLLTRRQSQGLIGFAMLYPWLMFSTELSTVRVQEIFVLYRSYLWEFGLLFAVPAIATTFDKKKIIYLTVPLFLILYVISMERLVTLSHPILIWEDAEKLIKDRPEIPGASRIYYNHGIALYRNNDFDGAVLNYKKAIGIDANLEDAHGNLGMVYFKTLKWTDAIAEFDIAMNLMETKHKKPVAIYMFQRAQAYEYSGNLEKAREQYKLTCSLAKMGCERLD